MRARQFTHRMPHATPHQSPNHAVLIVLVLLLVAVAGCNGAATAPSSGPTLVPVVSAFASPVASPSATAATDFLTGTWKTGVVTCAEENAAIAKAGFMKAQVTATDWDTTTCKNAAPPFALRFKDGKLVLFENGDTGWEGVYEIVDPQTFTAGDVPGDPANKYLTYHFTIDGDRLTIDVVADEDPDAAARLSDFVTQTAIYESAAFMRQP
jgi:hypothetical protein